MKTTLVTGIWDLGRDTLSEGWSRRFDHYIENFKRLLELNNVPLCLFIDPSLEDMVWKIRDRSNTAIFHHKVEDFRGSFFPFFDQVQNIRLNHEWQNQVGWLKDSTQGSMEYYNPMVMSKMFLLHNAKCYDPFNSDLFFWIDGGITNTVHPGYFSHDLVLEKIENLVEKFLFISFPYETNSEIHGFNIEGMKKFCNSETVNRVCRGGFFGGKKEYISEANDIYYSILKDSLNNGYMGTEESLFTIMSYLNPDTYRTEPISENGLISTFFENVKNNKTEIKAKQKPIYHTNEKIILYINTFNTPDQLQMLCNSFMQFAPEFLNETEIYLIDNSTNEQFDHKYEELVSKYNFNHIRRGNMGVCGGRQFAAEHFASLGSKYMLFFEDDMLIDLSDIKCSFGFSKTCPSIFKNLIKIMDKEDYDFLKLSFSEFYGNNGDQWAWHNVPADKKIEYFGKRNQKPLTLFKNIKSLNRVPYADGEIYYSNWPQIVGQKGNKKMFLDTKWTYPYEQTWMSHMYTLTKNGELNPAILLLSPITHNRVYFYGDKERKEN